MHTDPIAETIIKREKEWMDAWIRKDEQVFNNVLAEDFLLSSARGRFMSNRSGYRERWVPLAVLSSSGRK